MNKKFKNYFVYFLENKEDFYKISGKMSDDEEMEDFSMNDEDYRRAMDSNYHRKNSRMSREESMLGVFASRDDSDNDDDADGDSELLKSFGTRDRRNKTGISFVSKGHKQEKKPPGIIIKKLLFLFI